MTAVKKEKKLEIKRVFVKTESGPYKGIEWEKRSTEIKNDKGQTVFQQKDVKVPKFWSDNALTIVASKYFKEDPKSPHRERGIDALIDRVVNAISKWTVKDKIFATTEDELAFSDELKYVLVNQMGSFNSPVWFNCFCAGSLVHTSEGMKAIEEIKIGDLVLTHKGRYRPVTRVMQRDSVEKLYQIEAIGQLNNALCSGEHPYEVYDREHKVRVFKKAQELKIDDLIIAPYSKEVNDIESISISSTTTSKKYQIKDEHIVGTIAQTNEGSISNARGSNHVHPLKKSIKDSLSIDDEFMYMLGYWIGDGVAFRTESDLWKGVVFSHAKDSPFMQRIKMYFESRFQIEGVEKKCDNLGINRDSVSFYTEFRSTILARWFIDNFTNKEQKIIPQWIMQLAPQKQLQFIQGLIDSDGTLSGKTVSISMSYASLAWQVREMFLRNQIPVSFRREKEPRIMPTGKLSERLVHNISINSQEYIEKIQKGSLKLEELGKIEIVEKTDSMFKCQSFVEDDLIFYKIKKIQEVDPEEAITFYNFSVEEDETYVIEGKSVHNCGIQEKPQVSACFIQSVDDTMESILGLTVKEGMLFKYGSGTGSNFSKIRSSKEGIRGGGVASGPVSFMKGYDAWAGVIRSGGKSRRAAKMAILNIEHPDIVEFVESKAKEERKAWALIDAGYDGSLNGEAYSTVAFQNQNNSVRVSDDFMQAVVKDGDFYTKFVKSSQPCEKVKARDLLKKIAEMAYFCGEPGIQFHNTMNEWHTCSASGMINASNPCGEFVFLDDSACNLASINLLKFLRADGTFDIEGFLHTVNLFIIAQEVLVGNASYPTIEIEKNSHKFRPLGLGFANLGALLMAEGIPYDSNEGRAYAASISALMTAKAYLTSADLARSIAPFDEFIKNKASMIKVLEKHRSAANDYLDKLRSSRESENSNTYEILSAATAVFEAVLNEGNKWGFRNSQVTLLAPTGTIGFMMDCDSTGVEPCMALVAVKKTSDGGEMAIVTKVIGRGLVKLGYKEDQIKDILEYLKKEYGIEGAPHLQEKHYSAFACAFGADPKNIISNMGHVKMMSAIQPFLSGAISKTVNLTSDVTEDQIFDIFVEAWKLGLKSITVYRDGSKKVQPMNMKKEKEEKKVLTDQAVGRAFRKKLPDRRPALTHKFNISSHEGYITVGLYPDTMRPGEIFIKMAKEGSTISGLMDTIATQTSIMLQYGVPLDALVDKFSYMKFEPSGFTSNPDIRVAESITDYIFRWLGKEFLDKNITPPDTIAVAKKDQVEEKKVDKKKSIIFGPPCSCGTMMTRTGCSYTCPRCGKTTGGCS